MTRPDGDPPAQGLGIGPSPPVDPAALRAKSEIAHALFGNDPDSKPRAALEHIDRYEVDSRLGTGSMGVVYQAWDPQLERPVAIKVLHHEVAADDKARKRLTREARALARLSHPNVIQVHDVGQDQGRVFVAMELVDGETMMRWLASGARSWQQVLDVLIDAGKGLGAAHFAGLVHRDFKPDNILIGRDLRVRVLDFGLVRAATTGDRDLDTSLSKIRASSHANPPHAPDRRRARDSDRGLGTSLTETGAVVGTPLYMSPEQLLDGRVADDASDQYSFCVTMYEALYRLRPFVGTTLPSIVANMSQGNVRPPPEACDVPTQLYAIVCRGLAPNPSDRWPSMVELLGALETARHGLDRGPPSKTHQPGPIQWWTAGAMAIFGAGLLGWVATWGSGPTRADRAPPPAASPARVEAPLPTTPPHATHPHATHPHATAPSATPSGDWCHVHAHTDALLMRGARHLSRLRHQGDCYECRRKNRSTRLEGRHLDCPRFMVCAPVQDSACP